jgi:hypothetical protein
VKSRDRGTEKRQQAAARMTPLSAMSYDKSSILPSDDVEE